LFPERPVRAMVTADRFYGIAMQESGASKRAAVKFGDWPVNQARRAA
jgi:hypothetical protein